MCVCANLLGENPRDMDISDEEESASDIEEEEENEDYMHSDAESSISIAPVKLDLMVDAEFRTEVTQSLERAFVEGHSVDNAAVELKTLRMASNVPLIRVKEAVVAGIVEKIPMVEGDAPSQRKEIHRVISRWGELINRIGGVDPVETISILQAHCAGSKHMPLFGQILAALYQEDIVEEDDIRGWHILPSTSSDEGREGVERDNFLKCWTIGTHMIQQFDDQDSSESDNDEVEKPTAAAVPTVMVDGPDRSDSDEDDSDETSSVGTGVPRGGDVSEDASEGVSASSTATSTNASEDEDESEETSE